LEPPKTEEPLIVQTADGVRISCKTPGTSIGYRIMRQGDSVPVVKRPVFSYDGAFISGRVRPGAMMEVPVPWTIYNGGSVRLSKGEKIVVRAQRIGYTHAESAFIQP
jgi:hypothetical protein